jgi:hypothetical protein
LYFALKPGLAAVIGIITASRSLCVPLAERQKFCINGLVCVGKFAVKLVGEILK